MAFKTEQWIWQAIIAFIRSLPAYGLLNGGIHESFTSEETTPYPFATLVELATPYEDSFGGDSRMILAAFDLSVFSKSSVEASNLDESLAQGLDGAPLNVTGQSTLICRRVRGIRPSPDVDDEGKKVYQVGGTYEVWTDQQP